MTDNPIWNSWIAHPYAVEEMICIADKGLERIVVEDRMRALSGENVCMIRIKSWEERPDGVFGEKTIRTRIIPTITRRRAIDYLKALEQVMQTVGYSATRCFLLGDFQLDKKTIPMITSVTPHVDSSIPDPSQDKVESQVLRYIQARDIHAFVESVKAVTSDSKRSSEPCLSVTYRQPDTPDDWFRVDVMPSRKTHWFRKPTYSCDRYELNVVVPRVHMHQVMNRFIG